MNMEQFRNALASDAREENEKLKIELEELKESSSKEIRELKEELEEYKRWCKVLSNRCYVTTQGALCMHCTIESCVHYKEAQNDLNEMAEYMAKHKIPRTKKSFDKVIKHMENKNNRKKGK